MFPLKYFSLVVGLASWSCSYRLEHPQNDIVSERVKLRSIDERSIDGSRTIHLSAFGEDHVLQLKPFEIFTRDFEIFQVKTDPNGNSQFNKVGGKQIEEAKDKGQLYTVNDGMGSMYITEDREFQAEGLLSDALRITPNEHDYHDDGTLAHTVHRIQPKDFTSQQDFIIPEPSENTFEEEEGKSSTVQEDVPAEVTVEVLVVFDYTNSKRLDFDIEKIRKYVGIFWSQIHYRYRDTSKPKINIVVSGLITYNKPEDETFIFERRYPEERVDKECLASFRDWLVASKASLPKHDVAIIQLGLDAGEMTNGKWDAGIAGLAYVGTACHTRGYHSGFAEDTARLFDGFNGAAHELAHILNAPHDGGGDAKACPTEQGFVMSGGWKKTFSTCSIEIMRKFVSSDDRKCLRDNPTIGVPLIDIWPVVMVEDLNEVCQLMFRSKDYFYPKKISEDYCNKMWCGKRGESWHTTVGGAFEGLPCALNKVCMDKKCVYKPTPSLDQQCQQRFGNQYKSTNVANFCKETRCVENGTGKQQSLGTPFPGTPCGSNNFCLNGSCYAM